MKRIRVGVFKRKSTWKVSSGVVKGGWSWWGRWRVQAGEEPDGQGGMRPLWKDRAKSFLTQDRHEADRMRFALEEALNNPAAASVPVARLDWEEALELHVRYHCVALADSTGEARLGIWRQLWAWAGVPRGDLEGITYLDQLSPQRVMDWRKELSTINCANTVNGKLNCASIIYNSLRKAKLYAGDNPFEGIKKLPTKEGKRDWLVGEEIPFFLGRAAQVDKDLHLFCALSILAGLRAPSEVLAARWNWITWPADGKGGYIRVPKSDGDWTVKDDDYRSVPLAHPLAAILLPHRSVGGAYIVAPEKVTIVGRRFRWPFQKFVGGLRWVIEGKQITAYSFRHSFATTCLQNGIDDYKVMKWMGHSKLNVLRRYEHLTPYDDSINKAFPGAALEAL